MIEDEQGERWLSAGHEWGHLLAGHALGFKLGPATCVAGTRLTGCAFAIPVPVPRPDVDRALAQLWNPYALMPASLVERLNHTAIWLMAGQIAEDLLAGPRPSSALVTGRVAELPELPEDETELLAAAVDDAMSQSDDEKIDELSRVAFRRDTASAAAWRSLMDQQTRELLEPSVERLRFLAQVLAEEGSLSAEAVTSLLAEQP